jgi:hypothetical protein
MGLAGRSAGISAGRAWDVFLGRVERAEEPRKFLQAVRAYYPVGIAFVGVFLYLIN